MNMIVPFWYLILPLSQNISALTVKVIDQGQGGAQGLEDGLALGLVMAGATEATVEERLDIYQKVRHHRASAIQMISNYGLDQKPPEEVMDYLEGQPLPSEYPASQ